MKRKDFLQTLLPASLIAFAAPKVLAKPLPVVVPSVPTPLFLKAGDSVAITCTASPMESKKLAEGYRMLHQMGLNVQYGNTVDKHWQRFGGTDKERTADLQRLLDDEKIRAIIFAKGGYGTMRMIDDINWEKFKQNPKWLVGFSDLTAVHLHVHANFGIPTIHGVMAGHISASANDIASQTMLNTLFGKRIEYSIAGHSINRSGFAQGKLVGGNLSLQQACAGSKSDIKTDGKILFIEDVSEYKYTIDRMLMNLKRSGKLDNLAGLVVGQFTATKTNAEEPFSQSIDEIIMDKVANYKYPVCFNFPAGHIKNNWALKLGVDYDFNVSTQSVSLFETINKNIPLPQMDSLMKRDSTIPQLKDSLQKK
jgi:muramoyltetrapeptide carboxypeptidase